MPELPEVQTVVNGINLKTKGQKIIDIWSDYDSPYFYGKKNIKDPKFFSYFKKQVKNSKIIRAERRAKNILLFLDNDCVILVHLKMTGHFLYGKYFFDKKNKSWLPDGGYKNKNDLLILKNPLSDPFNKFIHLVFVLDNGYCLCLSDMRKFAKVLIFPKSELELNLEKFGPEPLLENFSKEVLYQNLMKKPNGKIKTVLMNPEIIAGIGNIYSDEVLWKCGIDPESRINKIPKKYFAYLYKEIISILQKSISMGGDSMGDFRNIEGKRGSFQNLHQVYKKEKTLCLKKACSGIIERKVFNSRSSRFCPKHQKLFN